MKPLKRACKFEVFGVWNCSKTQTSIPPENMRKPKPVF